MNRKDRRAAAKKAVDTEPKIWYSLTSGAKHREPEPEKQIPGVNVPPVSEDFDKQVASNSWHDRTELDAFVTTIKEQSYGRFDYPDSTNRWTWSMNSDCKYVDIRIDMRDGGFIVTDRNGKRINLEQLKWQYKSPGEKNEA